MRIIPNNYNKKNKLHFISSKKLKFPSWLILLTLTKDILKQSNVGTNLGVFWLVIPIAIQLFLYYLVFSIGFRVPYVEDIPFIFYFAPLFLIWSYFAESLNQATSILSQYDFLIKKIRFPFYLIPIASSIAKFITYLSLLVPLILYINIYLNNGINNLIDVLFSLLSIFFFTTLVSLIVAIFSSLSKDIQRTVPILTNTLFWLTPIVYAESLIFNFPSYVSHFLFKIYPVNIIFLNFRYCVLDGSKKFNSCESIFSQLDNLIIMLAFSLIITYLYRKLRFLIIENLV